MKWFFLAISIAQIHPGMFEPWQDGLSNYTFDTKQECLDSRDIFIKEDLNSIHIARTTATRYAVTACTRWTQDGPYVYQSKLNAD